MMIECALVCPSQCCALLSLQARIFAFVLLSSSHRHLCRPEYGDLYSSLLHTHVRMSTLMQRMHVISSLRGMSKPC